MCWQDRNLRANAECCVTSPACITQDLPGTSLSTAVYMQQPLLGLLDYCGVDSLLFPSNSSSNRCKMTPQAGQ